MLRRAALAGVLILSASCNKSEGGDALGPAAGAAPGSGKAAGSGGSFSADLARELGAGATTKPDGTGTKIAAGDPPAAGSDVKPGEAKPGDVKVGEAKAGEAKPGEAKPGEAKPDDAKAGEAKAGETKASEAKAPAETAAKPDPSGKPDAAKPDPSGKPDAAKPGPTAAPTEKAAKPESAGKPGSEAKPDAPAAEVRSMAPGAPVPHGPIKVSADLAAIKLSLLPNWDRDVDEAGSFQYVVRIKGTQGTKTFAFHYGYDDPKAPVDRDQYKKYLLDTRTLTGEIKDRQRGAAWFLEGNDAAGLPAFRYVVLYGGKRLICYGSLYKDAESSRLGDDRDQTLIQAKQICETLAL